MFRIIRIPATRINRQSQTGSPSRLYKTIRYYSKKNDLCPPTASKGSAGTGTLYTFGAIALMAGGTIGYAKYDPDFRSWLVDTMPFTDDVIKFVFREGKSSFYDSLVGAFGMKTSKEYRQPRLFKEKVLEYEAPSPVFPKVAEELKPKDDYTEIRLQSKIEEGVEAVEQIVGDIKQLDVPKLPLEIIGDLEKIMAATTLKAVDAFTKSVNAVRSYNTDIEIIVEESVDDIDPKIWDRMREKSIEKDAAIEEATKFAAEANKSILELKQKLKTADLGVPEILVDRTKANIKKVQNDLAEAKKDLDNAIKKAKVTDKYWPKVLEARKFYNKELQSLFPNVNIEDKYLAISDTDIDLFVLHAVSQVLFYQKELHRLETISEEKLNDAIEYAKRTGDCNALTTEQICRELEREKRSLELAFQQKCLKLKHESESELRKKLKLQSEAFCDHLDDAVKTREMELERLLNRKFDEELTEERCKYKMQVSAMVGRLKGMEEAMRARADCDKSSQQAQILWSACQALFKSVKAGCPGVSWIDQLRPLSPEIIAVQRAAAGDDELVKVVIAGIPMEAKERGVFPEDALRERFLKLEKVARSLALLPEEGGRLHLYFLSYLQSLLLLKATNPIPQAELNDEIVDFTKLSANEILQRARYWLDRGDFAQTLKYMNLLTGAPKAVSRQWMNETRILLETQQAANTLMAYAAASGLTYL